MLSSFTSSIRSRPGMDAAKWSGLTREALLEALLEEHYAAVYHLALSLLDDHAAAASAAQQTFARALLDQHRYRPEEGLHRWLYSIVLETCERMRKKPAKASLAEGVAAHAGAGRMISAIHPPRRCKTPANGWRWMLSRSTLARLCCCMPPMAGTHSASGLSSTPAKARLRRCYRLPASSSTWPRR